MGVMARQTLALFQDSMHTGHLIHIRGHFGMADKTKLSFFSFYERFHGNRSMAEMTSLTFPFTHWRMNIFFLKLTLFFFMAFQACLWLEAFSDHPLRRTTGDGDAKNDKQEN